jgi:hypothetical protein
MAEIGQIVNPNDIKQLIELNKSLQGSALSMGNVVVEVDKLKKQFEEVSKSSLSAAEKQKAYSKILNEASDNQKKIIAAGKQLDSQQKALTTTEAKLSTVFSSTNKSLIEQKLKLQDANKAIKDKLKADQAEEGSLVRMRQKLSQLTSAYDNSGKRTKAAAKEIGALSKEIELAENETNRFQRGVGGYANQLKGMVTGLANGTVSVAQFRGGIINMGKAMLSFFLSPVGLVIGAVALLGIGIKKAVSQAKDYQFANAELAGVLGITRAETIKLQKESQRLGATTAFTALEVTGLQIEYARLGFAQKEIMAVTESTINLSIAAKASAADTAAFVGSTIRGFGLVAEDAARVTDIAAKSYSTSALNFEKLKTGLGIVAPAAAAFGDSVESTTAKLAKMADAGIDASTAGTSLRNIYLELSKKGITYDEAMQKIATSTDKLSTANDLFGKRGAVAGIVLSNQSDAVKELTATLEDSQGAAQKMADEQLNTLEGSFKLFGSAWSGLLFSVEDGNGIFIKIFQGLVKMATGFLTGITDGIKFISKYKEIVFGLVAAFVAYNTAVKISTAETKLNTVWTKISAGLQKAWGTATAIATGKITLASIAQKLWNATMAMNPIGAVVAAVALLAAGIAFLIRKMKEQTAAQKDVNDVENTAQKSVVDQKIKMQQLLDVAKDETKSKEERLKAIKALNELSPKYLGGLTLETINTEAAKKATDDYITSLIERARVQAAQDKLVEIEKKRLDAEIDAQGKKLKWYQTESGQKRKAEKEQKSYNGEVKALKGIIEDNIDAQNKSFVDANAAENIESVKELTKAEQKALDKKKKAEEKAAEEKIKLENATAEAAKNASDREYERKVMNIELNVKDEEEKNKQLILLEQEKAKEAISILETKRINVKKGSIEEIKLNEEVAKEQMNLDKAVQKLTLQSMKATKKEQDQAVKDSEDLEKAKAQQSIDLAQIEYEQKLLIFRANSKNDEEFQQKKFDLDKKTVEDSLNADLFLLENSEITGVERIQLETRIAEEKLKLNQIVADDNQKKHEDQLKNLEEIAKFSQDIASEIFNINAAFSDRKLAKLEADNEKGLLSEQEYATEKAKIERKSEIMNRASAIFNIGINTAVAISKVLGQTGIFGLAAWIPIAALAALQAAAVVAAPLPAIPAYLHGGDVKTKTFTVAEDGKPELWIGNTGKAIEFNSPGIVNDSSFIGGHIYSNSEYEAMKSQTQTPKFGNQNRTDDRQLKLLSEINHTLKNQKVPIKDKDNRPIGYTQNNSQVRYLSKYRFN